MAEEERTCYIGNLPQDITQDILEELFVQVGPVEKVILKVTDNNRYALVLFEDEETVPFAIETMNGVRLFNTEIYVKPRSNSQQDFAYRKRMEEKARTARNLSQPYTPPSQSADRKRDHMGMKPIRQDNWRQSNYSLPPPPLMPNLAMPPNPMFNMLTNIVSGNFNSPPPPRNPAPQQGYTPARDGHRTDNWHTPDLRRSHSNQSIPGSLSGQCTFPSKNDSSERDSQRDRERSHSAHRNRDRSYHSNSSGSSRDRSYGRDQGSYSSRRHY